MRGEELKRLCDDSGLKPQVIYERAGFNREHFYKILKKKDVSVEEFTRIAGAVGRKPGDLLENSAADLVPYLPLVEQLKAFSPNALPRVQEMLRAAALMLEEATLEPRLAQSVSPSGTGFETYAHPSAYSGGKTDTPVAALPLGPTVQPPAVSPKGARYGLGRHGSGKKGRKS